MGPQKLSGRPFPLAVRRVLVAPSLSLFWIPASPFALIAGESKPQSTFNNGQTIKGTCRGWRVPSTSVH